MTQKEAFDVLRLGYNVFLTGPAGSGKTHLINRYIKHLHAHGVGVAITASTGIAATHLGGRTIHSWSGIGVRSSASGKELAELATKKHIKRTWQSAKVLVIDEISMLHAHQLDMIDQLGRHTLNTDKPFGGMQVIICGDFFQLPPVTSSGEKARFAYECDAWSEGAFQTCYLHEQFRQGNDPLLTVLNDIRSGAAGERTKVPLRTRYKKEPAGAIQPTRLFTHNTNVDAINQQALDELPGEAITFRMETRGFKALVESLKRSCLAPEKLQLKIGAEVMFVKNAKDGRYVNGTRGVVEAFDKTNGCPIIRTQNKVLITAEQDEWRLEENGVARATLTQIPLRLAWAITVHKSQGMTLDAAEIDLSDAFEPGMGYVALSRVRSLAGLKLLGLNEIALSVHPKILTRDQKFTEQSKKLEHAIAQYSKSYKKKEQEKVLLERFNGSLNTLSAQEQKERRQKKKKTPTHEITRALLEQKYPLEKIIEERSITLGTILNHMEKLKGLGSLPDIQYIKPSIQGFETIYAEFTKSEDGKLTPIFKRLNGAYSFDTLKLVRLFVDGRE